MISCPQRARLRRRTLRNLGQTDWLENPVKIRVDEGLAPQPVESQCRNAFLLLRESLQSKADYILFLEDDLEFNRHFLHNLMTWRPLLEGDITLASFFNPGIRPLACDMANHCFVANAQDIRGSLAYLLSWDTVAYLVQCWTTEEGAHDIRIPRLAQRLNKPLLIHCPSLVYHVGYKSTWDENFFQAVDFDPTWQRPV